jgi:hypothetical protein
MSLNNMNLLIDSIIYINLLLVYRNKFVVLKVGWISVKILKYANFFCESFNSDWLIVIIYMQNYWLKLREKKNGEKKEGNSFYI